MDRGHAAEAKRRVWIGDGKGLWRVETGQGIPCGSVQPLRVGAGSRLADSAPDPPSVQAACRLPFLGRHRNQTASCDVRGSAAAAGAVLSLGDLPADQ